MGLTASFNSKTEKELRNGQEVLRLCKKYVGLTGTQPGDMDTLKKIMALVDKADLSQKDEKGNTALHIAASYLDVPGNAGLFSVLSKNGARANVENNDGKSPWTLLVENGSFYSISSFLRENPRTQVTEQTLQAAHALKTRDREDIVGLLESVNKLNPQLLNSERSEKVKEICYESKIQKYGPPKI